LARDRDYVTGSPTGIARFWTAPDGKIDRHVRGWSRMATMQINDLGMKVGQAFSLPESVIG
jgi:hypothetical protein